MRNKAHSLKPEVWARMVQQDGCEVGGGGLSLVFSVRRARLLGGMHQLSPLRVVLPKLHTLKVDV